MTPFISPTGLAVLFRTYSRRFNEYRESWDEVCDRTVKALVKLGCLTRSEAELVMRMQENLKTLPSGRWLWVGGTKWLESPENFYGAYNCYSGRTVDWKSFAIAMDLAMQGTGTGAMLEDKFISQLPTITTYLDVKVIGEIGSVEPRKRRETTEVRVQREYEEVCIFITVGDSRKGWVDSYHKLLELSSSDYGVKRLKVLVDVSNVRPPGEPLKGFGGTSNPSMLEGLYTKVAKVLNKANGRKLTAVECCLIIDEAALVIVSGNIRRCLAYGSMVSTDKGRKAIQDIEIGDMVLTTQGYHPVTDKFEQGVQSVCRIITSGSQTSLKCTERHHVAVLNGGTYKMVPAGNLQRGDLLVRVSPNGAVAPDRILSVEWNADKVETFDIEVSNVHEFVCEGLLVHNSAGMKQGSSTDLEFAQAKLNLWQQDEAGNWRIDPERDALRMSNHTRVFHTKPTEQECIEAVRQQYYSGEGAIQFAPEAIARANADLFPEREQQVKFIKALVEGRGEAYLRKVSPNMPERELNHRMERWGLNPCGEIIGADFLCNLSEIHLNTVDPFDFKAQEDAFKAGGIMVASLLHHKFPEERLAYSRELDPIVGVSFTGLFDFFVNAFGVDWLRWWEAGRPDDWKVEGCLEMEMWGLPHGYEDYKGLVVNCWDNPVLYGDLQDRLESSKHPVIREVLNSLEGYGFNEDGDEFDVPIKLSKLFKELEKSYLSYWKKIVQETVWEYCDRHGLKRPNRYTTCQPAGCGSKELLRIFDQGLIYADEVMEEGQGEVKNIPLTVRKGIGASTGIANAPLNLMRVTLANGRLLRLTPNHRLSVQDEWVRTDELIPGMRIDYSIGNYTSTKDCSLVSVDLTSYVKYNSDLVLGEYRKGYLIPVKFPKSVSTELAYFIGAMFGNGCADNRGGTGRVRFTHQSKSVLGKLQKISESLFGIKGVITTDSRSEHKHELALISKPLYDWLLVNGLLKTTTSKLLDRIPLAIRCSSKSSILSFFAGLVDTDGCVREKGSLSIDSASEPFLRNLQQIGEAVGLCFSIFHNTRGKNHQSQKDMWGLCLSRMLSQKDSLLFLNLHSVKCSDRPIPSPKREFKFNPYEVVKVEWEEVPDYSYDFAVEGKDDDDSWYWQGAIKSHNTKSLLTGASPGWHPAKAQRFIRRITFGKNDPVALACIDYGYSVIPSQSDKDENGNLLNDPFDPRCTEWLVEIPVAVNWADLPDADEIDISKFSVLAQVDFAMQVQQHYAGHNVSSTWELREDEIEPLGKRIYQAIQNNEGYISAALLARFDDKQTYPRLPFEPIDKATYDRLSADVLKRRVTDDFKSALARYDKGDGAESGPAGCDSDKCLLPLKVPNSDTI